MSWRRDLAWVLLLSVATFVLSSLFELNERLATFFRRHESWQMDELLLSLLALSLGLAWYAWRRRREAVRLLAHNRELSRQLIAVQEGERLALARELHDELAQHCTAIRVEATYIQRAHDSARIAAAAQRVASSAAMLQDGVRRLLRRLRPAELDELGLVAAMSALCEDWSARSGAACRFRHDGPLDGLGEAVDTTVYRVAQEALANVMRHAGASDVQVALQHNGDRLALVIEDDGCGFDTGVPTRGFGLLGAGERAAALGGRLETASAPGGGTCIRLQVPARAVVAEGGAR